MALTATVTETLQSFKFAAGYPKKTQTLHMPTKQVPMAKRALVSDPTYPTFRSAPNRSEFSFDAMEDALAAFARGEFLVVMDDENRENEGDLIISASKCTTEKMAWMIKHTR